MNTKSIIFFFAGAAIGSVVTWLTVKEHYEKLYNEDVSAEREARQKERNAAKKEKKNNNIKEYEQAVSRYNYSSRSGKEETEIEVKHGGPYIITPEEFGDNPEYDQISLTYYEDRVLTEDDFMIEDPEALVGIFEPHFGEYEDDAVHVRNDALKIDYEILRVEGTYEEVLERKPYLRNNE